jgi:predicted xylose isomerase-like sugar epimerase
VHGPEVAGLVRRLDDMGYRGDFSFEVFNDDYTQLPAPFVAVRARQSVKWLTDQVSRRSLPIRKDRPRARQPG